MSKKEYLFTDDGEYLGYLSWQKEGQDSHINKFIALNEEPYHFLQERFYLNEKNKVYGTTEYATSKKSRFGKPLKSYTYEPTDYKTILRGDLEPNSVNYHLFDNMKDKFTDVKLKTRETKEQIAEKISSGIDNANYVRKSVSVYATDKTSEKVTSIQQNTQKFADNTKDFFMDKKNNIANTFNSNKNAVNSKISQNKEKFFNKYNDIKIGAKEKVLSFTQGISAYKDRIKAKFNMIRQTKNNTTTPASPITIILVGNENLGESLSQLRNHNINIANARMFAKKEEDIMGYVSRLQNGDADIYNDLLNDVFVNKQTAKPAQNL